MRASPEKKRALALFYLGPLIVWMGVIFVMSTGAGGSETSVILISRTLRILTPGLLATLTPYQMDWINYGVRKLGHFTEYAVLALLAVRAFQYGQAEASLRAFGLAFALCAFYAVTDEIHQAFVPVRSSSSTDILIDVAGAALCLLGTYLWFGLKSLERRLWRRAGPGN
jgi:VanZ family protein